MLPPAHNMWIFCPGMTVPTGEGCNLPRSPGRVWGSVTWVKGEQHVLPHKPGNSQQWDKGCCVCSACASFLLLEEEECPSPCIQPSPTPARFLLDAQASDDGFAIDFLPSLCWVVGGKWHMSDVEVTEKDTG